MEHVEREAVPGKLFKQRYRLRKNLESGGIAEVYLADDLLFQRAVVVDIIYEEVSSQPGYREKLEAEARISAALDHPNIARTIDWGFEDGMYFLVYEYVEGRSLAEMLVSEGSLPSSRAARIASEVAAALQFAHGRNLMHGGLSPRNIMIDETGQVKVLGFGIAWSASGRGYTQYLSPEQIQRLAIDGRSDVYSLGVVFFEMLTGRLPFDDADIRTVAWRHLNEVPSSPAAIAPAIPPSLNAITMKSLSKNPALRYRTAQEMRDALLRYLEGTPERETVYVEKRGTVPPWLWAVIAGVALLAIAGIILAILLTRSPQIAVPSILGLSETEARQTVEQDGLTFMTQDQFITNGTQQAGTVLDQNPAAGSKTGKGSTITATVARELRMPEVLEQNQASAEDILRSQGINNIQETNVPVNDATQIGKVVQQAPVANTLILPDTVVVLQIGQQSTVVVVPTVVDLDQNTAIQLLQTAGLKVNIVQQQSTTVPAGRVISQSPAAGQQVNRGSTLVIVVSQVPPSTTPSTPGG
jgi:eukaryotic-like serine/threonine-protein kinase